MHIIFLIHKLSYSGAPKMLTWVANQMSQKGHDVEIVAFFSADKMQVLDEKVAFHSLSVKQSGSRLLRNTVGMLSTTVKLHKYMNQRNPDLIVSFLDSVGYVYLLINHMFGKRKMVVSERVDPSRYHGITSKIRFHAMKYADGIVYQTAGAKDICDKKMNTDKGIVIPNPVVVKADIQNQLENYIVSYQERDNRIVTVGRLSLPQKRQDILIKTFSIVHEKHPEMELYIYGDGEDKEKIREMIRSAGLNTCVHLAGRIEKVEEAIYNARAFALTSDFEGIPNSLIEAMTIGVPSVATDCSPGGAALLVINGINGFLVDCGDATEIANKLITLIENEVTANRFSVESPKIAQMYSEETIASKWEGYFSEVQGTYSEAVDK